MNLRQWLINYAISYEEAAVTFGVTEGVISSWLKHGVPRSRRGDVVARTNGEVVFYDDITDQEEASLLLTGALVGLETIQLKLDKQHRKEMQHFLKPIYHARDLIEGR